MRLVRTLLLLSVTFTCIFSFAQTFSYPNFKDSTGLSLMGSASVNNGTLVLTPDSIWQEGTAWYGSQVRVAEGFTTSFRFRITHTSPEILADGLWFVLQTDPIATDPSQSGVSVEFDTFKNAWDPNANHIAILNGRPGIVGHGDDRTLGLSASIGGMLADGQVHQVTIKYLPGSMSVTLDGKVVCAAFVDLSVLLPLDSGKAWVGLNGWSGQGSEQNSILRWRFASKNSDLSHMDWD